MGGLVGGSVSMSANLVCTCRYTPEGAVLQESGLAKQSRHEQSSSHLLFPIMLNFATTDTAGHTNRGQSPSKQEEMWKR